MPADWTLRETAFQPDTQHHSETIFTSGNGYLCTRGALEESFPGDRRATFLHGVFDATPLVVTELANAPDWLPLTVLLNGERFAMDRGTVESFERVLDLQTGVLTRSLRWRSPRGETATLTFERFASLADPHLLLLRVRIVPGADGIVELRASLNGRPISEGPQGERLLHWRGLDQADRDGVLYLHSETFQSAISIALAMRLETTRGQELDRQLWDVRDEPTLVARLRANAGQELVVEKYVGVFTSRDVPVDDLVDAAVAAARSVAGWTPAYGANRAAWAKEWERCDVVIGGDAEAQLGIRFNLFQLLIAAPRLDDRVNIGAKTLSGFGYRGHAFWDTEIFMLPLFTYTSPHIARNLLHYRWARLPQARAKAQANGVRGAQFPWESADTGEEVTPTWVPHYADRSKLIRIWTGEIELHISADIAYAAHQYWRATGDDAWMIEQGAELVLDTARFWAARAEWNAAQSRYEYRDVIGPDEYHEHVDNNFYTNRLAQWNLQTALAVLDWLQQHAPGTARALITRLELTPDELALWRDVIARIYLPVLPSGLIAQFEDYFQREDVDLAALEPRAISVQQLFGIEATNKTQVLKQPDVLMLLYLLTGEYSDEVVRLNYDYYTLRTDHTYGSSLGPSIQAIMACRVGRPDDAYTHFMRALHADLRDVRGNANDGIHGASAGGTWQAVVFGFGGLRLTAQGWEVKPQLPRAWNRLEFKFMYRGELIPVVLVNERIGAASAAPPVIRGFILDLDGVITDTAEYHYRGWKRLADEHGWPFDRAANERLRGVSRRESLLRLLGDRAGQFTEAQLESFMQRKNAYYVESIREITPADLLPGALELLRELKAAGIKIGLGSASKNAPDVIDRLGIRDLFDAIADGGSVARQKPAPDLFLHAAGQLHLPPHECVVVEDAEAGIEAARAGGFYAVGLGPPSRVGAADAVFPDLAGVHLADILQALARHHERPHHP